MREQIVEVKQGEDANGNLLTRRHGDRVSVVGSRVDLVHLGGVRIRKVDESIFVG